MNDPFDLVSFLARSENRVEALQALASEPATRAAIQAETGVPRATLSRILADFRERGLAAREGHRYRATPLGDTLATELRSVLESVETTQSLQAVGRWLPADLGVDLADFSAVEVTLPTPIDPMAPVKRAAAAVGDAPFVRAFCYSVVHAPILAEARATTELGQRFEAVVAAGVLDVVSRDPELAEPARELFASGNVDLFVHDGAIEPQLIIAGTTTMFLVTDDDGAIRGLVEIGDERVEPWATETFEAIRREAEPLDPDRAAERLSP